MQHHESHCVVNLHDRLDLYATGRILFLQPICKGKSASSIIILTVGGMEAKTELQLSVTMER